MDDHLPTEGGAANTPPFPKLRTDTPAEGGQTPSSASPSAQPPVRASTEAAADDPFFAPEMPDAPHSYEDADRSAAPPPISDALQHTLDGARRDARRLADRATEAARKRADRTVRRGFDRAADRLYDTADRIDRAAQDRLGPDGPPLINNAAQSSVEWIEGVAEYLRSSDIGTVQQDLERRVRERPMQTILLAVGAGWIIGRLMRR